MQPRYSPAPVNSVRPRPPVPNVSKRYKLVIRSYFWFRIVSIFRYRKKVKISKISSILDYVKWKKKRNCRFCQIMKNIDFLPECFLTWECWKIFSYTFPFYIVVSSVPRVSSCIVHSLLHSPCRIESKNFQAFIPQDSTLNCCSHNISNMSLNIK